MGMTLTQMRVRVRKMLRLGNTSDADDNGVFKSDITDAINDELKEWWLDVSTGLPDRLLKTQAMTYTANSESVVVPAAARGRMIRAVLWLPTGNTAPDGYVRLRQYNADDIDGTIAGRCGWALRTLAHELLLRPVPTGAESLLLVYNPEMTELSADSDEPQWVANEYRIGVLQGACARLMEDRKDTDEAERRRAKAEEVLLRFRAHIEFISPPVPYITGRNEQHNRSW